DARRPGEQADGGGGTTHESQSADQRGPAAQAVADVTDQHAAQGAKEERDAEGGERGDRGRGSPEAREEDPAEDQRRRGAVDEEVVELDGGPGTAGQRDAG